jgi:transglycosylase-like protein
MRTPGRLLCRVGVLVCSLAVFSPEASGAVDAPAPIVEEIQSLRGETWRWQRLMRVPLSPTRYHAERSRSEPFRRWVLEHWRRQAVRARRAALSPPRLAAWLCIHRHEGPWNARTGNGYYGGLQMDMAFQRRWGPDLLRTKGTANRWRPIEQIWVAERAYRSGLGFSPWPNTARYCGLS